jgi:hypothetical protein
MSEINLSARRHFAPAIDALQPPTSMDAGKMRCHRGTCGSVTAFGGNMRHIDHLAWLLTGVLLGSSLVWLGAFGGLTILRWLAR